MNDVVKFDVVVVVLEALFHHKAFYPLTKQFSLFAFLLQVATKYLCVRIIEVVRPGLY